MIYARRGDRIVVVADETMKKDFSVIGLWGSEFSWCNSNNKR